MFGHWSAPSPVLHIERGSADYPAILSSRLGTEAPAALVLLGSKDLLNLRKTALFCSARTPGDAILRAHDPARRMRDEGVTVISGFHSPIEKECLRILLRGKQPIIVCPARAIEAMRVPDLMLDFEKNVLARCTPCHFAARREVADALAEVHVELLLIHPFREGNGRIARALASLMAAQASLPPMDFSPLTGRRRNDYFAAVQAGLGRNYRSMAEIFAGLIEKSLRES